MIKSIRLLFFSIMIPLCTAISAQEDTYFLEVGLGGGGCFYMGDANSSTFFLNNNGMTSALCRYNINQRWSLKANLAAAGIEGDTKDMSGSFPGENIHFSRTIYDFGVQLEISFLGYGMNSWANCHRFSPYYMFGIGLTGAKKPVDNICAVNFPVGIGFRYKLAERVNVGMEWSMRFSTSDRLDVTKSSYGTNLENPFLIKGKGMKNKDSYSFTMIFITFDVFKKPCDCNNN